MELPNPTAAHVPFKSGDIIKERYTLLRQIGAGTYGAIFAAQYRGNAVSRLVAIKFEKDMQQYSLQYNEVNVMKALAGSSHFAKFYRCGTHEGYKFVCMELLGPSLIKLVNRKRPYSLTLFQLLKFGVQSIKILQELHQAGFVHRDVKPENFVIGNTKKTAGTMYLIDFGLCKRLTIQDGKIVKPTNPGSLRGTLRYASPNGHKLLELGRHDDLISLLYMMVEYYTGKLPWSNTDDPDEILQLKDVSRGGLYLQNMPPQFQEFENHIFSLDYEDEPNYKKLIGLIFSAALENRLDLNNWPFEWESELNQQRAIVHKHQQQQLSDQSISNQNINQETKNEIDSKDKTNMNQKDDEQLLSHSQLLKNQTREDHLNYELTNINLLQLIQMNNMMIIRQQQQHSLKQQRFYNLEYIYLNQQYLKDSHQSHHKSKVKQNNKQQISSKDNRLSHSQSDIQQLQSSINQQVQQIDQQDLVPNSKEKEQDQIQQQNDQENKQDQDINLPLQKQQSEELKFEDIQQNSNQQNNDEQQQLQTPNIQVKSPVQIENSNNHPLINIKTSPLNQYQTNLIPKTLFKNVSVKSKHSKTNKNFIKNRLTLDLQPLMRSISESNIQHQSLQQHTNTDADNYNEIYDDQLQKSESAIQFVPSSSKLLDANETLALNHSNTQIQLDYQQQQFDNQNDFNIYLKEKKVHRFDIKSPRCPKSPLFKVQFEQTSAEEQQLMMQPAILDQSFTIDSSKLQNFSIFQQTEEFSQQISQQSSIQSCQSTLNLNQSLSDIHNNSSSNSIQRRKSMDQPYEEISNLINNDENTNINNQNNNSKQVDPIFAVFSPPKQHIRYETDISPRPIKIKSSQFSNKQHSPQQRTHSPLSIQSSTMNIMINQPFSAQSSQNSLCSPVSSKSQMSPSSNSSQQTGDFYQSPEKDFEFKSNNNSNNEQQSQIDIQTEDNQNEAFIKPSKRGESAQKDKEEINNNQIHIQQLNESKKKKKNNSKLVQHDQLQHITKLNETVIISSLTRLPHLYQTYKSKSKQTSVSPHPDTLPLFSNTKQAIHNQQSQQQPSSLDQSQIDLVSGMGVDPIDFQFDRRVLDNSYNIFAQNKILPISNLIGQNESDMLIETSQQKSGADQIDTNSDSSQSPQSIQNNEVQNDNSNENEINLILNLNASIKEKNGNDDDQISQIIKLKEHEKEFDKDNQI